MQTQIQKSNTASLQLSKMQSDLILKKELITPLRAKEILNGNIANRQPRQLSIDQYSMDMINGNWIEDTGEAIKISKEGILLDGQNRLMAIIKSDKSIYFNVIYNVNKDVFKVLDTGARRTAGDTLHITGVDDAKTISSYIRCYFSLKSDLVTSSSTNPALTNALILKIYNSKKAFWDNVNSCSKTWNKSFNNVLVISVIGGFYSFLSEYNEEKAFQFFDELCCEEKTKSQVIRLLRKKLFEDKLSQKKVKKSIKNALIIKTWNYFVTGKEITILKHSINDEFPKPVIGSLI